MTILEMKLANNYRTKFKGRPRKHPSSKAQMDNQLLSPITLWKILYRPTKLPNLNGTLCLSRKYCRVNSTMTFSGRLQSRKKSRTKTGSTKELAKSLMTKFSNSSNFPKLSRTIPISLLKSPNRYLPRALVHSLSNSSKSTRLSARIMNKGEIKSWRLLLRTLHKFRLEIIQFSQGRTQVMIKNRLSWESRLYRAKFLTTSTTQ